MVTLAIKAFTFYCSSIKRCRENCCSTKQEKFTFYCSSIKRDLYQNMLRIMMNLHSIVVLLKGSQGQQVGNSFVDLHSIVVLLKESLKKPLLVVQDKFTFYCSSIKR